jgi:hypothetical protein
MGADKAAGQQRGKPFKPGVSGNPRGRPQGSRNTATLALEALLDGQAAALTQKAIELALSGDMAALRLCLERIIPPRKDRPVTFALSQITSAQDAAKASSAVLAGVAAGEITPSEAVDVCKLIDTWVKAFEAVDLSDRLDRLERATN